MKKNSIIARKRRECAERGHGPTVKGTDGIYQCSLCGQRFQPGENSGVATEGSEALTQEEEEAMREIKRSEKP